MAGPLTALRVRFTPDSEQTPRDTRPPGRRRGARGRGKRKRTGIRRFFTWRKLLAYVAGLCALLTGAFTVLYYSIDIPKANAQAKAQSNVYKFSDGKILARTGEINREMVTLDRVPTGVQHAFVAAENKSFYKDSGVDPMGILRGLVNTATGKGTQGGSTITQQYVKNYYLSQEQTATRKIKELVISLKVDQRNSKEDILAGYLNTSYFGRVAYGVQAAARAYYDKDVDDLTVEEGAYLAALVQAPSQYDWAVASPKAKRLVTRRWNYVLDNMVDMHWLDPAERKRMRFPVPVAPEPAPGLGGQAGYLVDAARNELIASGVSEQELAAGGWTITLNVDPAKQRALEETMHQGLDGSAKGKRARADAAATQGGAVSVDPRNGRIVALYGGRDYTRHYLSNATRGDYQVGPVFEPVSTAASLDAKMRDGATAGGLPEVKRTAGALGMETDGGGFATKESVGLGLMGSSPLRMAGVYASFDHEGKRVTPSIVKSARRGDETAGPPKAVGDRAIAPAAAQLITRSLIEDGGATAVRAVKRPSAGKGGISDDKRAAWYVGYTPDLVTAVALFGEDAKKRKQIPLTDARVQRVAELWSHYTGQALGDAPPAWFDFGPGPGAVPVPRQTGPTGR
ncbi:transglycosylase domain-containing protein [Streptomyces rapamycinicus]|uniref:Glycosyl transferase n=2 Tax=Streptomyces rapamycinicus TaxID=1226757 RepID=A0A0A0NEK8_STRRN|nr:transglycosylase domain-containing protein [Streptomyces rapamycinicus]AGP52870.1 glycosyl transferase [Streptomyces rapamycinicus NRRL 5491]MBB4780348.1 membrane peptidoglycan carboxypeptidase [Streptomyces rapamycinicus]RLV74997.1 glycosyl transferase [Streptomyces rapamycinicus NRRL 5491]UTO61081.1 transglycosylase domain-containing protein [Streptomyces rapamycinicus]UTP29025.1 transglycosylase domain-containing protein [Streptomyces rapamycinicus NRRL 5491]